ncbi:hypothetical protein GBA52_015222 [Prunus armeniaca]|nr:hypothetical protein GBA52_015222 [Prunus armeniaca]
MRKGWLSDGRVDGVAALRRVKKLLVTLKWAQLFPPCGPVWAQGILSRSIHLETSPTRPHHLEPEINAIGDALLVLGCIFEIPMVVESQIHTPLGKA